MPGALHGRGCLQHGARVADRNNAELRVGFGIGTRIYFARFFSFWLEKRWIVGERFSANRTFGAGGLFEDGRQKTLYVPINSLGLAIRF